MVNAIGILVVEIIIGVLCVCLTIYWSANMSTNRLAIALGALTAAVGRIAGEVADTAEAIRDHINADAGISAETLNGLTDRLTAAADALDTVQAEAAGAAEAPVDELPGEQPAPPIGGAGDGLGVPPAEPAAPPADGGLGEPAAPPAQPDLVVAPSDLPPAGNQNGVGSEFAGGLAGEPAAPPADALSEPPADGGLGEPSAPPTGDGSPIE